MDAPHGSSPPAPPANVTIGMVPPYISVQPLGRWLGVLLVATALVAWVAVGFDVADIRLLARRAEGATPESIDRLAHKITGAILFTAQTTLLVVTALAFVLWTYAARSNLRALGARRRSGRRRW